MTAFRFYTGGFPLATFIIVFIKPTPGLRVSEYNDQELRHGWILLLYGDHDSTKRLVVKQCSIIHI